MKIERVSKRLFYFIFLSSMALIALGFNLKKDVTNYYGIEPNLNFNENDYRLSWSSHPNDTYYKQEYLPKGEKSGSFNNMLLIDFIITDKSALDAVKSQVITLNERKKTDAVCNYAVLKNESSQDYMLDFVVSQGNGDNVNLVEWNAYHYEAYSDSAGHKGVLLFGYSHRAYDDKVTEFFRSLRVYRHEVIKKVAEYPFPKIQIKQER